MWVEENTIIVRQWFTFEFDGWPQSIIEENSIHGDIDHIINQQVDYQYYCTICDEQEDFYTFGTFNPNWKPWS